ncbi:hypothetical protein [Pontiella sulfatireligans]|uniref:Uncharacterized protein n=1 Tax=Pontiella sulfatireligans TaxID=2750658 RepID=A0A6C2UG32_9BACT|nr:hypothetical protein [Pontiella sulfatireligans]VGO19130.1 hypothetical protein SCARR_01186 [Pontiella sulfatireligans]
MSDQGLIGFRYRDIDKLDYNRSGSAPNKLGLQILHELRAVDDWDPFKKRIAELTPVAETHRIDYFDGYPVAEIRRHFPHLEYDSAPTDYHELFAPLQGTLAPYLDGKLSFMPDASDFIRDSQHCEWAYITNLDTNQFEVWKGNQLEPDHEDNRMVEEDNRYGKDMDRMGYYPCAMVRSYDFEELPNPGLFLTYYSFSGDLTDGNRE